ncbi:GNAT family N-acetyltransferase [Georgenia sp. M64]|uniref:GNAT family N-acetyltransferase n=1 Tax=Georgenia sp. M64 TaxID=3120520 RepID=UPI0030DE5643
MPDRPLTDRLGAPEVAELPAAHLGLSWRTITAADLDAVRDLALRCAEVDRPVSGTGPGSVVEALGRGTGDALGGFSRAGELEAVAVVDVPPGAGRVHQAVLVASLAPQWRGRGIGRALLDWQDGRARQLLAARGGEGPARLAAYVDEHHADRRRLYVAAGFSAKRTFHEMRRAVADPVPAASPPEDVRIGDLVPALDDAVREVHNAAFADHWGAEPLTAGSWTRLLEAREPAWSKVAVDTDGAVVGYAMTCRRPHPRTGAAEGWTELLGVRTDHRGRGVARALLAAVLRSLAEDGVATAGLTVDTVEPPGAGAFYEELGYRREGARILYTIEI